MNKLHAGLLALASLAIAIPALADPPAAPVPAPVVVSASASAKPAPSAIPTQTVAVATITGRADKPQVLIELQRQTAVSAARDAHQAMREAWMKKLQPSTTRAVR